MKKVGFFIFIVALVVGSIIANIIPWGKATGKIFNFSVNFGHERGSGNLAVEPRSVSGFTKLDVSNVFQVDVTAQKDYGVEIEADDNLLQFIKTEVRNGTLEISLDKRVKSSNPLRVRISAPNIERIEASGASRVRVVDLKNTSLNIDTSGASKITLAGETGKLGIDVSGASSIDAQDLVSGSANVDASGASHVSLNVTSELISDASGASRITYSGSPKVSKSTSGAGTVSQR